MNTLSDTRTWMKLGAKQGAKWGVLLAGAYILWLIFVVSSNTYYPSTTTIPEWASRGNEDSLITQYAHMLFGILIIAPFVIGGGIPAIIPALIIGAASGAMLGWIMALPAIRPYPEGRLIASAIFGLFATLIGNVVGFMLLRWIWTDASFPWQLQLLFVALPSLVYIGVCLVLSQKLPTLAERAQAKEMPINPCMLPT